MIIMNNSFYISVSNRSGHSNELLSKLVEGTWEDALKKAISICHSNPEYITKVFNGETGELFEYGKANKPGYIEKVPRLEDIIRRRNK